MAFDAFVSYSSGDKTAADATCAVLEGAGIRCWIAPRDIRAGEEYGAAIIEAIDHCRVMVLVFSSSANDSSQIHREIERAVAKGIPILPVRIEEVTPTRSMEYFLGGIHWLDALSPPLEKHLRQLAETVKAMLKTDADSHGRPTSDDAHQAFVPRAVEDAELSTQRAENPKQPARATHVFATKPAGPNWRLFAICGAALVALVAGGVWLYRLNLPAHAEERCAEERGAKSAASNTPSVIIFNNNTAAPIKIFWLDFQGGREFFGELAAGTNYRQETYVDHLWVVTNAQGGCLGFYKAEAATQEVTIRP